MKTKAKSSPPCQHSPQSPSSPSSAAIHRFPAIVRIKKKFYREVEADRSRLRAKSTFMVIEGEKATARIAVLANATIPVREVAGKRKGGLHRIRIRAITIERRERNIVGVAVEAEVEVEVEVVVEIGRRTRGGGRSTTPMRIKNVESAQNRRRRMKGRGKR